LAHNQPNNGKRGDKAGQAGEQRQRTWAAAYTILVRRKPAATNRGKQGLLDGGGLEDPAKKNGYLKEKNNNTWDLQDGRHPGHWKGKKNLLKGCQSWQGGQSKFDEKVYGEDRYNEKVPNNH